MSRSGLPAWVRWFWGFGLLAFAGLVLAPASPPELPEGAALVEYDGGAVPIRPLNHGPTVLFSRSHTTGILVLAESCPVTGRVWRDYLAALEGLPVDRRVVLDLSGEPGKYARALPTERRSSLLFAAFPESRKHLRVRWVPILFVVDSAGEVEMIRASATDSRGSQDARSAGVRAR